MVPRSSTSREQREGGAKRKVGSGCASTLRSLSLVLLLLPPQLAAAVSPGVAAGSGSGGGGGTAVAAAGHTRPSQAAHRHRQRRFHHHHDQQNHHHARCHRHHPLRRGGPAAWVANPVTSLAGRKQQQQQEQQQLLHHRSSTSSRFAAAAADTGRRATSAKAKPCRDPKRGFSSGGGFFLGATGRGGGLGPLGATTTSPEVTEGGGMAGSGEGEGREIRPADDGIALDCAPEDADGREPQEQQQQQAAAAAALYANNTLTPSADHPQLVSDILDIVGNSITVEAMEVPGGAADAAATAPSPADQQMIQISTSAAAAGESPTSAVDATGAEPEAAEGEKNSGAMVAELVAFTLPLLVVWLSNPIMSLVDTAVVGAQSSVELAALGPATSLCDNLAYMCGFLAQVTTNLGASALACGDSLQADRAARTGMFVAVGTGTGVSYVLLKHGRRLLQLFLGGNPHVSAAVLPHSASYVYIRAMGFVAVTVSMVLQSAYLARKDIATPIKSVAGASVVNLVLDCVAVFVFGMGIRGAALSTTVAQWAGLLYLMKEFWPNLIKSGKVSFLPYRQEMKKFLQLGAPTCLALSGQVATCIAVMVAASGCDTVALAAHQIVYGVFLLFCPVGEAVSQTVQTYLPAFTVKRPPGRNGAPRKTLTFGKPAVRMIKVISTVSLGLGVVNGVLAWMLTAGLPALFTPDPAVWAAVRSVAPMCGFGLALYGITMTFQGAMMATREVYPTAAIYTVCSVLFSGNFFLMRRWPNLRLTSVWAAYVVYHVTRCAMFAATVGWSHRVSLRDNFFSEDEEGQEESSDSGAEGNLTPPPPPSASAPAPTTTVGMAGTALSASSAPTPTGYVPLSPLSPLSRAAAVSLRRKRKGRGGDGSSPGLGGVMSMLRRRNQRG